MFGGVEYNFGKAKQIEQRNAKFENFVSTLFDKIASCDSIATCNILKPEKYTDAVEKNTIIAVKTILKAMDIDNFSDAHKQEIFKSIKESLLKNYQLLNYESNK
jgi:hypothetical protein